MAGDEFNLKLSELRTEAVIDYLIKDGIDKARIKGKGLGETQLKNNCEDKVECSESGHQLNRRSNL